MLPALSFLLPAPFSFCRTMALTSGTAQMRLGAKEMQEQRKDFRSVSGGFVFCICTGFNLYKELQILFYISICRKLYNEPQFYLKDVEFSIIHIHISVENFHVQ